MSGRSRKSIRSRIQTLNVGWDRDVECHEAWQQRLFATLRPLSCTVDMLMESLRRAIVCDYDSWADLVNHPPALQATAGNCVPHG